MRTLIRLLIILCPLQIFGFYVSGKYITPGAFGLALVSLFFFFHALENRYKVMYQRDKWIVPFILFVITGALSMMLSPFLDQLGLKGSIQIFGILIAMIAAYAISLEIDHDSVFYIEIIRLVSISFGIVGVIAIAQSIYFNFIGYDGPLYFSYINALTGNGMWHEPGKIGHLYRANSILHEPAHFTRFMGLACGLALIRAGILGRISNDKLSSVMPMWAAWSILGGYMVSVSILGYVQLVVTGISCLLIAKELRLRSFFMLLIRGILLLSVFLFAFHFAGVGFSKKINSIGEIIASSNYSLNNIRPEQVSALAVSTNLVVAIKDIADYPFLGVGLGGHPISYKLNSPAMYTSIQGLNADDAASLLLRLMSETGSMGTLFFIIGSFSLLIRARKAILTSLRANDIDKGSVFTVVSIGVAASWAGLLFIYLARTGLYFESPFWIQVGITASIPQLLFKLDTSKYLIFSHRG